MARMRRRDVAVWPSYVDAMTSLLMVMMFVLTIFMVAQSVLRETISTQDSELSALGAQVAELSAALGMAEARGTEQANRIATLSATLAGREQALAEAEGRIGDFQSQVAALLAQRDADKAALDDATAQAALDAETLAELRDKLTGSQTELTALTLRLEAERKRAEETLTLLAAAETSAAKALEGQQTQSAALTAAQLALTAEQEKALAAAREVALLNAQAAELRAQLGALQDTLDAAKARDAASQVQLEELGTQLNTALAQVAAEQRRRAEMEEAERIRLEAEKADLEKFRSEFFGQLRQVLAGREGVRIVGDRFVFSSEVLFTAGSADLAPEGRAQIERVVSILNDVARQIPEGIDWIIRVDGHTDDQPLSGLGDFADNWELSQARALSVVRYMQTELGFSPQRLAAAGFGEWQPVASGNSSADRALNRRIELKLTER